MADRHVFAAAMNVWLFDEPCIDGREHSTAPGAMPYGPLAVSIIAT
jgi:hypothetical protein